VAEGLGWLTQRVVAEVVDFAVYLHAILIGAGGDVARRASATLTTNFLSLKRHSLFLLFRELKRSIRAVEPLFATDTGFAKPPRLIGFLQSMRGGSLAFGTVF
jgi:hypothetical protein